MTQTKFRSRKSGIFVLGLLLMPSLAMANVVINEIAWMGTGTSTAADEWIELYNNGSENIDLTNWILKAQDDAPTINLSGSILSNSFFLLERTDDATVPSITADLIYTGALSNDGEVLILKNASGNEVDKIDASGGWLAGDNATKQTMQWNGSIWITATATPKAMNASVSEPPPQQQQSQSQPSSGGGSSQYIPPENLPKIKAYAGENKTIVVGASVEFRGQAFGLEDEPLDNARFLWTFGDGSSKEGQNITHTYYYPGEYIVVLNLSSGEYSASDMLLAKAKPNEVFISEVKTGPDAWIELENKSKEEIDISGAQFKSASQIFIFPQNSRVRPNAYLAVPTAAKGFILYPGKGNVDFLYSGGFKADVFNYDGFPSGSESFIRNGEGSAIAQETPGAKNSIITSANSAKVGPSHDSDSDIEVPPKTSDVKEKAPDVVPGNQNAAVINVGADNTSKSNINIYLFGVLGLILFAGVGILFIRRHGISS